MVRGQSTSGGGVGLGRCVVCEWSTSGGRRGAASRVWHVAPTSVQVSAQK